MNPIAVPLTLMIAGSCLSLARATEPGPRIPDVWRVVYDFLIQDVCVDADGRTQVGISPLGPACIRHRDLLPGEPLPYHKADWPGAEESRQRTAGYERSDSFPFVSPALGPVVVQTFDFGGGDRRFGAFDHGDGGQVVAFSADSAAIVLTEDGGRGLQLMAGPDCVKDHIEPRAMLNSWVIVGEGARTLESGAALAKLRIVTDSMCPRDFDYAYTQWRQTTLRFRSSSQGELTAPLLALVSSHFGGQALASADHLERFYFTRELGWTRWERWANVSVSKAADRQVTRAQHLKDTNRCRTLEPGPAEGWLMIDCREWTNMVKPDLGSGDQPTFWLERLQTYPLTMAWFADTQHKLPIEPQK